MKLLQY